MKLSPWTFLITLALVLVIYCYFTVVNMPLDAKATAVVAVFCLAAVLLARCFLMRRRKEEKPQP